MGQEHKLPGEEHRKITGVEKDPGGLQKENKSTQIMTKSHECLMSVDSAVDPLTAD